jgi:hypothetical protein
MGTAPAAAPAGGWCVATTAIPGTSSGTSGTAVVMVALPVVARPAGVVIVP